MAGRDAAATRVQVYLTDPRVVAALKREARQANIPLSQAAGRSLARGLARSLPADPDDRLLQLDRALRDHMRSTTAGRLRIEKAGAGVTGGRKPWNRSPVPGRTPASRGVSRVTGSPT